MGARPVPTEEGLERLLGSVLGGPDQPPLVAGKLLARARPDQGEPGSEPGIAVRPSMPIVPLAGRR